MAAVQELAPLVGVVQACQVLDVPRSSYYRARRPPRPPLRSWPRPRHPRALTSREQDRVRAALNSERFVDRAPRTVSATLLDEGVYLCPWRTMYRLLQADGATRERRLVRRHPAYQRPELLATAPGQVWRWGITKLRGPVPGVWYSLYVVLDIFSRMVVGWTVAEREDALVAEQVIADAYRREAIGPAQLTAHADRGAPMTSKVLADLMEDLGITKSHGRPSVSDDNPYSEAQFKTMKYGPTYPPRFASRSAAQAWVADFVTWYTTEHRHAGIGLLPPIVVHQGRAGVVTAARQMTLDGAQAAHPERFVRGQPHPPQVPSAVWINPPTPSDGSTAPAASTAPGPLAAPGSRVAAASAAP